VVTPGQRHESTQLAAVLDAIRVPRPGGLGPSRKRPDHVIADQGYSYPRCRRLLRRRGIPHTIPERRAGRRGRPLRFDAARYKRRNVAERGVNALKRWRGVATRHEKRAVNYRAAVVIAALVLWVGGRWGVADLRCGAAASARRRSPSTRPVTASPPSHGS
jgi:transposase